MADSIAVKVQYKPRRRRRPRQCRWRAFSFGAAIIVVTSLPPTAHSLLERPRKRQQDSLSISSSKTKSATYADSELHSWTRSNRMADQDGELVHQLLSSSHHDDFANRLLNELNDNSISRSKSSSHPLETVFLYGIITIALASALLTPTTFVSSLVAMLSSVALLVPWLWIGRASLFTKESMIMVITTVLQLAPRYWRERGDSRLVSQILPVAGDLLQKMVLAEAWSRIWRIAGRSITKFFQRISLHNHSDESQDAVQGHLPEFVHNVFEFLDASIRKGTAKAVLKTLERNVHSSVGISLESLWGFVHTTVLPVALIPLQGWIPSLNPKDCSL